ncbi:dihydropteroate synthase [Oceanobacillus alkalisoli]|uniref:dihydropteroate synthase n=1 Tax=Oceanobacillus alkalisoli TaxID=2925113 RepID=UPI001EF0D644|nr:dihydropteroate synthase [Oceanobacillus alkalisoli]MCF3944448.1 dihydropteroate synthase [Oceanobacillus alkalisoli]MCG5105138.1 dihydropteroate synthase [Oceanobacillus alkalisoli]
MILKTRSKQLHLLERTHIMGILNVTPDSFSDGGSYTTIEKAVAQAVRMVEEGADIIDVGGESTRPGHTPITSEEEISRIVPVIQSIKTKVQVPISVDTFKADTAEAAIEAGADIINDIWGAKKNPEIAKVVAKHQVPIILMHNRTNENYNDLMEDMLEDLRESIAIVKAAGVPDEHIIIDPGIGFAKSREDDLRVMQQLERLQELAYPLLLATSRKRMIGHILDVPSAERDIGTGATTCLGIVKGAHMVRVHNVKVNAELAKMTDAMLGKGAYHG